MTDHVPDASAVYAWRRRFRAPPNAATNPVALAEWISKTVRTPSALLPPRELSHSVLLSGLAIGGSPLTDSKISTLQAWAQEPKTRRWLINVVESVAILVPPLYVGETDNLARRTKDHLAYKTDFSQTLRDKLNLSWTDCELWYTSIPEAYLALEPKERRTLLELLVARVGVAGCTSRPG